MYGYNSKKPKKRKFYALVQNKKTGAQKAVEVGGKCGKKYAEARVRVAMGDDWDIIVLVPRGSSLWRRNSDHFYDLKRRISQGVYTVI